MLCCWSTLPSALKVALLALTRTAPAVTGLPSMPATISLTGRPAPSATTCPARLTSSPRTFSAKAPPPEADAAA
ncbi:hypothetical protein G6F64_015481 [Rhizopus arrhizus]|uniref:Secreted protein n=1 Tax=Rhizopus oryzae TaxID=64495 RepID=A0A9P7BIF3_RHIOR|nr:hypothetical protein G6F64_015481 [Rhizopus arrhizus]